MNTTLTLKLSQRGARIGLLLLLLLTSSMLSHAQPTYTLNTITKDDALPKLDDDITGDVYTGYMGDDVSDFSITITLAAGEALVATAEGLSGDMDTVLFLLDADGVEVAMNDDRDSTTLDSRLVFIVETSAPETAGTYSLVLSNFPGTSGDYRLTVAIVPADEAEPNARVPMSGAMLSLETTHFRINYTTEGADAADLDYVRLVAEAMEDVYDIQINQMGWPAPPPDDDGLYDVYLINISDELGSGDLGLASPESVVGDNPNTPDLIEESATTSYLTMDNDYSGYDDPITTMQTTAAHEFPASNVFCGYGLYYEKSSDF